MFYGGLLIVYWCIGICGRTVEQFSSFTFQFLVEILRSRPSHL